MSRKRSSQQQPLSDLKAVLALPEGRRYLFDLLDRFGVLRDIWCPSAEIHRRAGQQAAGLSILEDIRQAAPDLVTWRLNPAPPVQNDDDEEDTDA